MTHNVCMDVVVAGGRGNAGAVGNGNGGGGDDDDNDGAAAATDVGSATGARSLGAHSLDSVCLVNFRPTFYVIETDPGGSFRDFFVDSEPGPLFEPPPAPPPHHPAKGGGGRGWGAGGGISGHPVSGPP